MIYLEVLQAREAELTHEKIAGDAATRGITDLAAWPGAIFVDSRYSLNGIRVHGITSSSRFKGTSISCALALYVLYAIMWRELGCSLRNLHGKCSATTAVPLCLDSK
jgi:hypothetical protein